MTAALLAFAVAAAAPDASLLQSVLTRFVTDNGKVDYSGIKANSGELDRFVRQLADVSPDSHPALYPTRDHRLAYWLNAYNALVLHAIAREYPEKRTRLAGKVGQYVFFFRMKHTVGGVQRTLDDIEARSIRRAFHDPRIHFAIVCASAGCPWLSRQVYTAENVQDRLEDDAKRYFSQARNFRLEEPRRVVRLPKIFDWFKDDFGSTPQKVLDFVSRYRPAEAKSLKTGTWNIRYFDYDWSPNDVRR